VSDDLRAAVIAGLEAVGADYTTMECDPDLADTAAFCAHYDIPPNQSANAIVLASKRPEGIHAMFLVLATTRLDVNRTGRDLMGVKKVSFAPPDLTADVTGMVMGGVTPFGRPEGLPLFVDAAVTAHPWVIVGGGTRDMKVKVDPEIFARMPGTTVVEGLATPLSPPEERA
jgi:prolyl-tRNA editing enzyme YbaK/EbsC (Cys-tRNA(Pro) deacylase)